MLNAHDIFVPIPAAITLGDIKESLNTNHIELTNNHKIKRLNLGYGINLSVNKWHSHDDLKNIKLDKTNKTIGITTNLHYQIMDNLFLGIIYRPSIYNIRPKNKFEYEHFISFDFAFKIPIRKKHR